MSSSFYDDSFRDRFSSVDLVFAKSVCRWSRSDSHVLFLAAALASWAVQHGHSCCDLNRLSGKVMNAEEDDQMKQLRLPTAEVFRATLEKYPAMTALVPRQTVQIQPLVLDPAGHLYLNRYYHYERNIALSYCDVRCVTNSWNLEKRFCNHCASKKTRECATEQSYNRDKRISECVMMDYTVFWNTLGTCCADIVGVQNFEHVRACKAH